MQSSIWCPMVFRNYLLALATVIFGAVQAQAAELIMVERQGCHYCIEWKQVLGPIYPQTPEGEYAPLRVVQIADGPPDGVTYARKVLYTPTFILIDDNREIGRIEGYPGEDHFWGLLKMMLKAKTDFVDASG